MIALHSLTTMHCNLMTDIRIAKETGHSAIEINGGKLKRYLAQGYSIDGVKAALVGLTPVGLTYVQDVERQAPQEYDALLKECEEICSLAEKLGGPMVQLLTGPLDPGGRYKGFGELSWPEQRRLTAKNLAAVGEIGRAHGIKFFLEALTWTPLHKLDQVLEVVDAAGQDNLGIVIDFWHLWDSGTTADEVAKLDRSVIFYVHFCDSLERCGERGTYEQRGRDVWTGAGRIPLQEWVDAVKATGFDGYWSCELLSPKYWELDPCKTARDLRQFLEYLLL
jgi:sugar phosphate isomerase/epimerase